MSYNPPKKNTEYIFYISLVDQSNLKVFKANPTLASGDFRVSKDGGNFASLATLPVVTPSAGRSVKVTLSADEMNADNVVIVASDQAGDEWCDYSVTLQTVEAQLDDISSDVWDNTTRTLTASSTGAALTSTAENLTQRRGDTWSITITGLGDLSGREALYFTAKNSYSDADTASMIQIEETDGLKYIVSTSADTSANGSITVNDESAGNITLALSADETAKLSSAKMVYDIQMDNTTLQIGYLTVVEDVTRATV